MGNNHTAKISVVDTRSNDGYGNNNHQTGAHDGEKAWKGFKPTCQAEFELMVPRLCVELCALTATNDENERAQLLAESIGTLKWKIEIVKEIKVPNNNIIFRKRNKPCVLLGYATQIDLDSTVLFVAFRGQAADKKIPAKFKNYRQEPFITSKHFRVGRASVTSLADYQQLLSLGLMATIMDAVYDNARRIAKIIITGHANAGSLATLLTTELVVDNSKIHEQSDPEANVRKEFGGKPSPSSPDHGSPNAQGSVASNKYYSIPDIDCITFGAPRTFDKITASKLHKLHFHQRVLRFVLAGDEMPTLPHARFGAAHVGDPVFQRLTNRGWYRYQDKPTLDHDKLLAGKHPPLNYATNALQMYKEALCFESPLEHLLAGSDDDNEDYEDEEVGAEDGASPASVGRLADPGTPSSAVVDAVSAFKTPSPDAAKMSRLPNSSGSRKRDKKKASPGNNIPDDIFD